MYYGYWGVTGAGGDLLVLQFSKISAGKTVLAKAVVGEAAVVSDPTLEC